MECHDENTSMAVADRQWRCGADPKDHSVVIFPHGAQKVFGWFGGHGFKGTMKYFTDKADQCREKTNPSKLVIP